MTALATALIPHVKTVHLAALILWCGGLFALPLMLALHDASARQVDYTRIRHVTHFGYIYPVTPAALVTIGSGTAPILLLLSILAILPLVLGKPVLGTIRLPDWLTAPQGGQLPFSTPSP